jgi:hypothetical protein
MNLNTSVMDNIAGKGLERKVKGTVRIAAIVLVIAIVILSIVLISSDDENSMKKIGWTMELQGNYPADVRVAEDGSITVWIIEAEEGWDAQRSNFYGISPEGSLVWMRSYYDVEAVTYGSLGTVFISGYIDDNEGNNYIIGVDEFNRTKMMIDCGNVTITSLSGSSDGGMFIVCYTHDHRGDHHEWIGQYWMKKIWANGTVQWEREWSPMTLKYMPNGTLTAWDNDGVRGISKIDGEVLWQYSFPDVLQISKVTDEAFYYTSTDDDLVCFDVNGTMRWNVPYDDSLSIAWTYGIADDGTAYYYGFLDGSDHADVLGSILGDGTPSFSMRKDLDHPPLGSGNDVLIVNDGLMEAIDRNGSTVWTLRLPSNDLGLCWNGMNDDVLAISVDYYGGTSLLMSIVDK